MLYKTPILYCITYLGENIVEVKARPIQFHRIEIFTNKLKF